MSTSLVAQERQNNRKKAEALFYLTEYSVDKIAALSGCDVEDVKRWIFGTKLQNHMTEKNCWFYKKEIAGVDGTSMAKYREVEPILIAHTKAQTLGILTSQVAKTVDKLTGEAAETVSIEDLKRIAEVYEKIDKIDRLEQGRATNITETKLDRMDATDAIAERRRKSDYIEVTDYEVKE